MDNLLTEIDAAEIRIRAERRLGESLIEQRASDRMNEGGVRRKPAGFR